MFPSDIFYSVTNGVNALFIALSTKYWDRYINNSMGEERIGGIISCGVKNK